MDFLDEAGNRDLAHRENKDWREIAEYDQYTLPLFVRLKSIDWPKLMALHRADWQRKGVDEMRARKLQFGCYCWGGFYLNTKTQRPRLIQRYPRLYYWFPVRTLALPIPTPVEYAQRLFDKQRALLTDVYARVIERERSAATSERQYLAERLKSISRVLSNDKAKWEPQWQLKHFLEVGRPAAFQKYTDPTNLGEVQAQLDYFWLCLREFHEAEKQVLEAKNVSSPETPPAISAGEPAGLIRKYYPSLGEYLPSPTVPDLVAEWYSDLSRLGKKSLKYCVTDFHERASNKTEFLSCLAILLGEAEQHAHLPGYGYRRHYLPEYLTPGREAEIEASGRAALRAVREWHTLATLSPIEQFLDRARKIELWQNERHQLVTREAGHEEWNEEYGVMLLALQRAVPTAKKKLLRAAHTELNRLLPTLEAGRPLKWQRLHDEGRPFFATSLTATYAYSEFVPLRPTQTTTSQISNFFFLRLYTHLFEKEWHVWQALILLAGALGEAAPPTPNTFQEKQAEQTAAAPSAGQSPWLPLLTKALPLPDFFAFLSECGLLTPACELTALGRAEGKDKARKAPWAGTLQALIKAGLLDTSAAAVCRALADPAGGVQVSLNEGTLRDYSRKAGAYLESANNYLRARGLLR